MNGDALLTGNGLVPGFAAFSTETTWWVKDPLTGVPGSVWSNLWMLNRSNLAPFPQLGITNVPAPPGPAAIQSHATGWLPGPGGGPAGSSFAGFFGVGILASGSRAGWFLSSGEGVIGSGATVGVVGEGGSGFGVSGTSFANIGVFGEGPTGTPLPGVMGVGRALPVRDPETRREILSAGVHGLGRQGGFGVGVLGTEGGPGWAGLFDGYTEVRGTLDVRGRLTKQSGGFRIDHPLDPGDKYLQHSFVESPDMKNVYDGVAEIDEAGAASVELPEWFGELNGDYRYQLTAIGEPAPDLHIAEEISDNRFTIAGGRSGMRVSWQVTGIRKDEWAEANPLEVEVEKREEDGARRLPEAELARQTPAEEELQLLRQTPASPVISPTREEMMEEIRRLDEELGSDEKLSTRRPPTPPEG